MSTFAHSINDVVSTTQLSSTNLLYTWHQSADFLKEQKSAQIYEIHTWLLLADTFSLSELSDTGRRATNSLHSVQVQYCIETYFLYIALQHADRLIGLNAARLAFKATLNHCTGLEAVYHANRHSDWLMYLALYLVATYIYVHSYRTLIVLGTTRRHSAKLSNCWLQLSSWIK